MVVLEHHSIRAISVDSGQELSYWTHSKYEVQLTLVARGVAVESEY